MDSADEERFRTWAQERVGRLHRTAYLMCGDWHQAEEFVQDTLAKAFVHWRRIADSANPDAYVRKILVNEVRQNWRRRRREGALSDVAVDAADGADERAIHDELMTALRQLPIRQRSAVVLRYFEQLSEAESAAALGCSVGTVKSATHRGIAALRLLLETEEDP